MSIATATAKVQYTLSSTVQALPVTFYFLENAHIKAIRARSGVADYDMILGTDYTLTGEGDEDGGELTTIATNMQVGDKITIKRNISITQQVNYVYNDRFPAETHERALDKLTMIAQQQAEAQDRTLKYPETEPSGFIDELPAKATRADALLAFDADGDLEVVTKESVVEPAETAATEAAASAAAAAASESAAAASATTAASYSPKVEVGTVAALKALTVALFITGDVAIVRGFYSENDGCGVTVYYDSSSSATADDKKVFAPTAGAGRWLLLDKASAELTDGVPSVTLPQTGNLYAFGDSQTYGNNHATGKDYTDGVDRLTALNRFVDMLGTRDQRALTINNYAVGGSRVSWADTANYYEQWSQFNAWGRMDYNWEGVVAMMCGWNNTGSITTDDAFHTVMRRSYEALIARALIDDYGGISIYGWTREGTSYSLPSWSCTGANNGYQYPVAGDRRKVMAFYYGDASASRYRADLETTEYVQFTLTNKRAAALFFDTSSDGGPIAVSVNGVEVWTGTSLYAGTDQYPQVVWLDNLPATAVIKFYGALGAGEHCYWLGAGWIDANTSRAKERTVIFGTTVANTHGSRTVAMLQRLAAQSRAAAAAFADYPVFWADVFGAWVQSTDSEVTDPSHLTPSGNRHVYAAMRKAQRLSLEYSPNRVDVLVKFLSAFNYSSGRLGLGVTGTPGRQLTLRDGSATNGIRVEYANDGTQAAGFHVYQDSNGDCHIVNRSNGSGYGEIHLETKDGTRQFTVEREGVLRLRSGNMVFSQTGDPEGAITAPVGSLFIRTDGGASTTLYVKESGTGNTGWVAK